jgi:Zn-dependent protease with chaperone function
VKRTAWFACFVVATALLCLLASPPATPAQSITLATQRAPATPQAPSSDQAAQPAPAQRITAYTLPPERDHQARHVAKIAFTAFFVELIYGVLVLLLILGMRVAPKYRDIAERVSSSRFVQALIFTPLLLLTIDILSLPIGVFRNHVLRHYGLSVQGWASWFADWAKGEVLSFLLLSLLAWILYAIIRKAQKHWWFYCWLISMPIFLCILFIQPLVIDPLFNKFEPLQKKDPSLTTELEKMVQRAGQSIPPERMFWMGASAKTTAINAYVAGFGASKRIVVWDTTIAKMSTPQIVYVTGHELGHYVLGHVPKLIFFVFGFLFVFFYVAYRSLGGILSRWGPRWQTRALDDYASLPALLLLLSILIAITTPVFNAFTRRQEHQADQYSLEVTHGLTPDSSQVAAQAFQILGDVNLADPDPSDLEIILRYNHPSVRDRVRFALDYDPWSHGRQPEFVK